MTEYLYIYYDIWYTYETYEYIVIYILYSNTFEGVQNITSLNQIGNCLVFCVRVRAKVWPYSILLEPMSSTSIH